MANPDLVTLLKRSVKEWNTWRRTGAQPLNFSSLSPELAVMPNLRSVNLVGANLRGADLRNADLSDADLIRANLILAEFSKANLDRANLTQANLSGAGFQYTNLSRANLNNATLDRALLVYTNLDGTDLSGADLSCADLTRAILIGTKLRLTNFDSVTLRHTRFVNVNLSGARNLDTLIHEGPSSIGVDTILKSEGQIPETFLRGTGVPEEWITQLPALLGSLQGIQFHSCFISHSHEDYEFCKRLHSRMRAENLRVWYHPEDMIWGRRLHEEIETQISFYDKLLIVLSPASMKSEWVATEIYHARQRELKEGRRILFPIALCPYEEIRDWKCFDADTGKDLARELREYLIPDDFSQWKDHDAFEAAFAKLLKGLKTK